MHTAVRAHIPPTTRMHPLTSLCTGPHCRYARQQQLCEASSPAPQTVRTQRVWEQLLQGQPGPPSMQTCSPPTAHHLARMQQELDTPILRPVEKQCSIQGSLPTVCGKGSLTAHGSRR